jgi:hypothetical protein
MSKGKENDRIADNAYLDRIVSFYQEKFITDQKPPLTVVEVWTDNCAGQYKCKQNFYDTRLQHLVIALLRSAVSRKCSALRVPGMVPGRL